MNTKTLFSLIAIFLVSLLTGCATVVPLPTQEGSMPPQMKSVEYYKTHLPDVIKKADATGDAATQFELAYVYGWRQYGFADVQKSNFWLEKAAAQNYFPAICGLSSRYYSGIWGYPSNSAFADNLASKAYSIFLSKPQSEWGTYDTYVMSGVLLDRGVNAKTKELAKQDICLAKNMGVKDENRIYAINKQIREKNIKCD